MMSKESNIQVQTYIISQIGFSVNLATLLIGCNHAITQINNVLNLNDLFHNNN